MTPTVFAQFLTKFMVSPQVMVFFHLRPLSVPSVTTEDRYTVASMSIPNCYRLIVRHGYTDEVITEDFAVLVYDQVRKYITDSSRLYRPSPFQAGQAKATGRSGSSSSVSESPEEPKPEEEMEAKLKSLDEAFQTQVLCIVGKEQMRIRASSGLWRRVTLHAFLWLRENTRSKMAAMNIPTDKLVEVGFVKEL